jgi:hypothetical protein
MQHLPRKAPQPRNIRPLPLIQQSRPRHEDIRAVLKDPWIARYTLIGDLHEPLARRIIPACTQAPALEPDMFAHVVFGRNPLPVREDLRRAGEELAPACPGFEA